MLGFNDTSTHVGHFVSSPKKGRKLIEVIVEEMKESDRGDRGTGMEVKIRRNKNIPPLPLPPTRIADLAQM